MARAIAPFSYYGGKSGAGRNAKVARWIIENLPMREGYAEPFAGALGVLLARPRVKRELINDADHWITNWWRCVREHPERMKHLCEHTPASRVDFERACRLLDTAARPAEADTELAWAAWTVIRCSPFHGTAQRAFVPRYDLKSGSRPFPRIRDLADRLRYVEIECTDATKLLDRLAERDDYSIYVDPPYATADTSPYSAQVEDRAKLREALQAQRSAVAISGYADEWDDLGWESESFDSFHIDVSGNTTGRVEKVWYRGFRPTKNLLW